MALINERMDQTLRRWVGAPAPRLSGGAAALDYSPDLMRDMERTLTGLTDLIDELQENPGMANSGKHPDREDAPPPGMRKVSFRGQSYYVPIDPQAAAEAPTAPPAPAEYSYRGHRYAQGGTEARGTEARETAIAPAPNGAHPADPAASARPTPTAGAPLSPEEIFKQADLPACVCSVEEVSALVARYRSFDQEMARTAVLTALEFRPGASVADVVSDAERKLQVLQAYQAGRKEETARFRSEAEALVEQVKLKTLKAVSELEKQIADLRRQAESEIETLVRTLSEREQADREAASPIQETISRFTETLEFLGAAPGEGRGQ